MKVRTTLLVAAGWTGLAALSAAYAQAPAAPSTTPPANTQVPITPPWITNSQTNCGCQDQKSSGNCNCQAKEPTNLWDLFKRWRADRRCLTCECESVIITSPPPPPAPKPTVAKHDPVAPKPDPVAKRLPLTPASAPAKVQNPTPKQDSLTLEFPPPAIEFPSPKIPGDGKVVEMPPAGPSPYFATAATPIMTNSSPELAAASVSSYHPTAATPTMAVRSNGLIAPDVSAYHPTAATPVGPAPAQVAKAAPLAPKPTPAPANPTMPTPLPVPVAQNVPAPLPAPAAMPSTPISTRPMPAPAAPVVPATTTATATPAVPANHEIIQHLLKTSKNGDSVEVRKASIQELVTMKANTPEVMVALDGLSDDPTPEIRAEAIIAAARLRMGR
jgi:hypothetical protein